MVPNNLSLGWGHSRSSSQCILKCHDWYKGQKQSDAFETLPGESRCTCGGPATLSLGRQDKVEQ